VSALTQSLDLEQHPPPPAPRHQVVDHADDSIRSSSVKWPWRLCNSCRICILSYKINSRNKTSKKSVRPNVLSEARVSWSRDVFWQCPCILINMNTVLKANINFSICFVCSLQIPSSTDLNSSWSKRLRLYPRNVYRNVWGYTRKM
jgi:hypothetical protein